MIFLDVLLGGLVLGGMYALVAIGFNLQYGIARVLNLAYGEFLVTAASLPTGCSRCGGSTRSSGMVFSVPVIFAANWLVYRVLIEPLARRAANRDHFEGETILSTFGLLFLIKGAYSCVYGRPSLLRLFVRTGECIWPHILDQSHRRAWRISVFSPWRSSLSDMD